MRKGRKRLRGVPELHDELKGRVTIALTPTGVGGIDAIAKSLDLSRSEVIERIGRGLIPLATAFSQEENEALSKSGHSGDNRQTVSAAERVEGFGKEAEA